MSYSATSPKKNVPVSGIVPVSSTEHQLAEFLQDAEEAKRFAAASRSEATRRAYANDFGHFVAYCQQRGADPLPASPETVVLYLSHYAAHYKVSTLGRRLSALNVAHKTAGYAPPTAHPGVADVWKGIKRTQGVRPDGKRALLAADMRRIIATMPDSLLGLRNTALLLIGYYGAFRRSELVALNREDLQWTDRGLILTLRRSKTDQQGEGRDIAIPFADNPATCPVGTLKTWCKNIPDGPLFRRMRKGEEVTGQRLSEKSVARIVKESAERAGLNPDHYAGHSLRAGFATQAAMAGASDRAIMNQTGHRSRAMVDRYIRIADLWEENAAATVHI